MDMYEFVRRAIHFGGERGDKVLELTTSEIAMFEAKIERAKQLNNEKKRIDLDLEEISIWTRKWWLEIRKKHNIDTDNLTYSDGTLYEIK